MVPNGAGTWEGVPGLLHWTWRCFGCDAVEYGGNINIKKDKQPDAPHPDEFLMEKWISVQKKPQPRLVTRFGEPVGESEA